EPYPSPPRPPAGGRGPRTALRRGTRSPRRRTGPPLGGRHAVLRPEQAPPVRPLGRGSSPRRARLRGRRALVLPGLGAPRLPADAGPAPASRTPHLAGFRPTPGRRPRSPRDAPGSGTPGPEPGRHGPSRAGGAA